MKAKLKSGTCCFVLCVILFAFSATVFRTCFSIALSAYFPADSPDILYKAGFLAGRFLKKEFVDY